MTFSTFSAGKRGETMDARELISLADQIAREKGLTQAEWCRRAGFDEFGKLISNTYRRGNCKLSVLTQLLKPLGYELRITRTEDTDGKPGI